MRNFIYLLCITLIITLTQAQPRLRPASWAQPIIQSRLNNLYQVDKGIFRSEQPKQENINELKTLGIQSLLNLRELHSDRNILKSDAFNYQHIKINTANMSQDDILHALTIIKNTQTPLLIHCWHGSDRTGTIVAAYRIVFQNWSKAQAIDEMIHGGYGYHRSIYPQLIVLIHKLDTPAMKKSLGL